MQQDIDQTFVLFADNRIQDEWIQKNGAAFLRDVYLLDGVSLVWIRSGIRPGNIIVDKSGAEFFAISENIPTGGVAYKKGEPVDLSQLQAAKPNQNT